MKQSILGILSSLMAAIKSESRRYHPLIVPLIDNSVNISSETRVYLLEDAMDLWAVVLQQTPPTAVADVVPLVSHLFPMLEAGSDTLRKALEITETYIYLTPLQMLTSVHIFLPPFVNLLENAKREVTGLVLGIVQVMIQSAITLRENDALSTLLARLFEFDFLKIIVSGLRGAHEAHQTSGPNRSKTWLDVLVETDYLSILSRIVLVSPTLFIDAVKAANAEEQFEITVKWLLSEWFRHLDNISHPEKKKLNCLALTALLQTGQPWILERLQELMTLWTEVALELYDEEDGKGYDYMIYDDLGALQAPDETAEQEGQRKVCTSSRILLCHKIIRPLSD